MTYSFESVSFNTHDLSKERATAQSFFNEGKYREVCDYVDGLYGWAPGEIKRSYSKEEAEFCLKQLKA